MQSGLGPGVADSNVTNATMSYAYEPIKARTKVHRGFMDTGATNYYDGGKYEPTVMDADVLNLW